jgi:hypothetical protein
VVAGDYACAYCVETGKLALSLKESTDSLLGCTRRVHIHPQSTYSGGDNDDQVIRPSEEEKTREILFNAEFSAEGIGKKQKPRKGLEAQRLIYLLGNLNRKPKNLHAHLRCAAVQTRSQKINNFEMLAQDITASAAAAGLAPMNDANKSPDQCSVAVAFCCHPVPAARMRSLC